MTLGAYKYNQYKRTKSNGHSVGLRQGLSLTGFFHTHPSSGISDSDRLVPSDQDLDARDRALAHNPNLLFYLITNPLTMGTLIQRRFLTKQDTHED